MAVTEKSAAPAIITTWSAVSPYGVGRESFVEGFHAAAETRAVPNPEQWAVPADGAHLVPDFDVRAQLGKKGTRSMDRATALAVTAVRQLIGEGGDTQPADVMRDAALVLGTASGSVHSIMSFARDTYVSEKPYMVDPARFPNAVMNCPVGTSAIWHGLHGPNVTIAGGRVSGLHALRYSLRLLAGNRAPLVLCGAVEEFSESRAWIEHSVRRHPAATGAVLPSPSPEPLGEGCAVLRIEPGGGRDRAGLAEVLAVEFGVHGPTSSASETLGSCLRRALRAAGVEAEMVWAVAPSAPAGPLGEEEASVLDAVFGPAVTRIRPLFGDTAAVSVPFQIAATLTVAEGSPEAAGAVAVISSIDHDGEVGCAVLGIR
ncbi:beta-ketoacyl synthase N-terminal-like domain-containing protein [Micromonospora sp. DT201]|uniref:beta-ketoacyl synthase N-terminal-like domain-containing protein n=1 Tax=Micromonospora sp. DT201 TaxID=3393442 RepID=UPI003CE6B55F